MEIVDAQIHTWMSDRPRRPWDDYGALVGGHLPCRINAGQTNTPEMAIQDMAEVGVDAALLAPMGVYGYDNSYEFEGVSKFPQKFRVVGRTDWLAPDVGERLAMERTMGMVGVRISKMQRRELHERGEFDRVLRACEDLDLVVSIMLGNEIPDALVKTLKRCDRVRFVLGHLGLPYAPPVLGVLPEEPFELLPAVLDLARLENVHMNLTGAPSLSRDTFPFKDLWDPIRRILDAYGPDRVMWGSDYTRTAGLHSHWNAVHYLKAVPGLDDDDLAKVYGATLRRVFKWTVDAA